MDESRLHPDPAPAAPALHTALIQSDAPFRIEVGDAGDQAGRFFRLLNSLVDSGQWARLSGEAKAVIVVYARLANSEGLAWPSVPTLERLTGMSRSSVYRGRRQLVDAGVLVLEEEGSRRSTPRYRVVPVPVKRPTGGTHRAGDSHGRHGSVSPVGPKSALRPTGGTLSRRGGEEDPSNKTAAPAPPPRRRWRRPPTREEAVAVLMREGGFGEREALALVDLGGPQRVIDAVDNLRYLIHTRKLKKTPKRYLRWYIRTESAGLYEEVERARQRALECELVSRLHAALQTRPLNETEAALLNRVYGDTYEPIRRRAVPMHLLEGDDDAALIDALLSAAKETENAGART